MQVGGVLLLPLALIGLLLLGARWTGRFTVARLANRLNATWAEADGRAYRRSLLLLRAMVALWALALSGLFWWLAGALWPSPPAPQTWLVQGFGPVPGNEVVAFWGSAVPVASPAGFVAWAVWLAQLLLTAVAILLGLAAGLTAVTTLLETEAAIRRRRVLRGFGPATEAPPPPGAPTPLRGARRIVILCDGTGNRPDDVEDGSPAVTNIVKLHRALVHDETQTTWYDPGVGTETSSTAGEAARARRLLQIFGATTGVFFLGKWSQVVRAFEGVTGTGITENIAQAYAEVVRQYRPGDRIYLLGFSRGAYTARCVAGVIDRCGLLRAENARYAADLVHVYRTRKEPDTPVRAPAGMIHPQDEVSVEFLGVFDTVASLGAPLWGWFFNWRARWNNLPLNASPMRTCRHVYHAMAMDERRSTFFPTPFDRPKDEERTTLEQVWFRGAHADIGGGYIRTGLSDITLLWMANAMRAHGLLFRPGALDHAAPDPLAQRHDELERAPGWRSLGSWPRWHPVPDGASVPDAPPGTLHRTVLERAAASHGRAGRADLLKVEPVAEVTVQAGRQWDRTGIVLDRGTYRITYLGGTWRDAEEEPCGPAGDPPEKEGWIRRTARASRRLPDRNYMTLAITVAHPRRWDLKEFGLLKFLNHVLRDDPVELRRQVAAIGEVLDAPGRSVLVRNMAGAGVLHAFANDLWTTAVNNGGAVRLRVERVDMPGDGTSEPCWTLCRDGLFYGPGEALPADCWSET